MDVALKREVEAEVELAEFLRAKEKDDTPTIVHSPSIVPAQSGGLLLACMHTWAFF
jgi:hypothetical protein